MARLDLDTDLRVKEQSEALFCAIGWIASAELVAHGKGESRVSYSVESGTRRLSTRIRAAMQLLLFCDPVRAQ
jgi:hypothetical protein